MGRRRGGEEEGRRGGPPLAQQKKSFDFFQPFKLRLESSAGLFFYFSRDNGRLQTISIVLLKVILFRKMIGSRVKSSSMEQKLIKGNYGSGCGWRCNDGLAPPSPERAPLTSCENRSPASKILF